MKITRISPFTGEENTLEIPVNEEKYERYLRSGSASASNTRSIQHVFPELSPEHREFILTGLTQEDWDSLNKYNEGEDD